MLSKSVRKTVSKVMSATGKTGVKAAQRSFAQNSDGSDVRTRPNEDFR
jgi:hypothetical protein